MLFDLQGKRRRVVQVTYLSLALLMGGGLVLFGVGSDAQGGLLDALGIRDSSGGGDSRSDDRLERAEERLKVNPRDENALKEVVRASYQLAGEDADPNTGAYGEDGRANLAKADRAWQRYLALEPKQIDDSLGRLMVQAYGPGALNKAPGAARAAEIVAEAEGTSVAFIQLVQYAALAGQSRKADLAGMRAVELAPKGQRKLVKQQVEQAKAAAAAAQAQAAGAQPGGGAGGTGTPAPPGAPSGGAPPSGGGTPSPGGRPPSGRPSGSKEP